MYSWALGVYRYPGSWNLYQFFDSHPLSTQRDATSVIVSKIPCFLEMLIGSDPISLDQLHPIPWRMLSLIKEKGPI